MGNQLIARGDGTSNHQLSDSTRDKRDQEQQALVDQAQRDARCLIVDHRETLNTIAETLLANESIDRDELREIMAGRTEPAPADAADTLSTLEPVEAQSNGSSDGAVASPEDVSPLTGPRFERQSEPDPLHRTQSS